MNVYWCNKIGIFFGSLFWNDGFWEFVGVWVIVIGCWCVFGWRWVRIDRRGFDIGGYGWVFMDIFFVFVVGVWFGVGGIWIEIYDWSSFVRFL